MSVDYSLFSTYVLQRTLNFDKQLMKDRNPYDMAYNDLYNTSPWANFTGTLHTWDRIHVSRFNDDGCWQTLDEANCTMAICDITPKSFGWGETRANYGKFANEYKSPVFCLDQWDAFREAKQAVSAILEGMRSEGEGVYSDFMRLYSLRSAETLSVVNSGADPANPVDTITLTDSMFTNSCRRLETGMSDADVNNIGQISMALLMRFVNPLLMAGYFNRQFKPDGLITLFSDIITINKLTNENPALFQRYDKRDFAKGGAFYGYGAIDGAGNYAFKVDMTPLRYVHVGSGVFERVFPWENQATTIGKRPVYSTAYELATYQVYHICNRAAREVFSGSVEQINPEMPFMNRSLKGKWVWNRPMANFSAADPCTGQVCEYDGTKGNKGFWRMEHQLGVKTVYPEIEMWILAARQPQLVAPNPICGSPSQYFNYYYSPYNCLCEEEA